MKIILSGLTLAGAALALMGMPATSAMALPVSHPQTSQAVSYWRNGHWHPGPRPYFYRRPVYYHPYRPYFYGRPAYHHPYWHRHYSRPGITIHF